MKRNLSDSYSIYQNCYEDELPIEQFFIEKFDQLPSKFEHDNDFDSYIVNYFTIKGFEQEMQINVKCNSGITSEKSMYLHKDKQIVISLENIQKQEKSEPYSKLSFFYNVKLGSIQSQLEWEDLDTYVLPEEKSNIHLIKSERGGLTTEGYDFENPTIDLELNYGKKFMKTHQVIINRLNNKYDKGFFAFWGEPGTGKSTYIKYLTSIIEDKEVIFIPPSMAEILSEPSIIPFLMKHKNSVLVIEDAERVISDRQGHGSSAGVSNILNLTDGILGDCLNIQIIATFNMARERIDSALLRKGRLVAEHKFDKLTIEECNLLLLHLGKNIVVNEPLCLADIYNIDADYIRTSSINRRIGFLN